MVRHQSMTEFDLEDALGVSGEGQLADALAMSSSDVKLGPARAASGERKQQNEAGSAAASTEADGSGASAAAGASSKDSEGEDAKGAAAPSSSAAAAALVRPPHKRRGSASLRGAGGKALTIMDQERIAEAQRSDVLKDMDFQQFGLSLVRLAVVAAYPPSTLLSQRVRDLLRLCVLPNAAAGDRKQQQRDRDSGRGSSGGSSGGGSSGGSGAGSGGSSGSGGTGGGRSATVHGYLQSLARCARVADSELSFGLAQRGHAMVVLVVAAPRWRRCCASTTCCCAKSSRSTRESRPTT